MEEDKVIMPAEAEDWRKQRLAHGAPDSVGDLSVANMPKQNKSGEPEVTPSGISSRDTVMGYDRQIGLLEDLAKKSRPETEEERKKRERRERSKRIIAAVSDGLSALGNLYFTTRYAPSMYKHDKSSAVNAVDDRIERLKSEREKDRDRYVNYSLKIGDLENQKAATLRDLEALQERMKLARAEAQRDEEKHGWLAELQPEKLREQKERANKAENDAIVSGTAADYAPLMQEAKLQTEGARRQSYQSTVAKNKAAAGNYNRQNQKEFVAWDKRGKEYRFKTKAAADSFAKQHSTWREENSKETTKTETKNPHGKPQQRTSVRIKAGGHPMKPNAKTGVSI